MYLIVDLIGDYKSFGDYNDVKKLLIEQVVLDLKQNMTDKSLENSMLDNINILEKLSKENNVPLNYIEEHLEGYSYKIIDLLELQRDLEDLKALIGQESLFDDVINLITKGSDK